MNNTVNVKDTKTYAFGNLICDPKNAKLFINFMNGKLSLKDFKKTPVFIKVLEHSYTAKIDIDGNRIVSKYKNPSDWADWAFDLDAYFAYKFVKAVETKKKKNIAEIVREASVEYDYYKPLNKVLFNQDFIDAVNKDKKYIAETKKTFAALAKKSPACAKFINVGWFDEPWMNGDTEKLNELLDKSLKLCDTLIKDEKSGHFHNKCSDAYDLFKPLQSGQSDSWDEWVHVFPNTIEYVFDFSLKQKLEKHKN